MYGAIYGDLIGSLYEYREFIRHSKEDMIKASNKSELLTDECFISDDTILTIAIRDAYLNGALYEEYLRKYILDNSNKLDRENYFKYSFSPNMIKWAKGNGSSNSIGNGAMMRISSVPELSESYLVAFNETINATLPTHNTPEALKATMCISTIIYLAKINFSKSMIKKIIDEQYNYKYDFNLDELRTNMIFNTTCNETIPLILYVIFNTDNFDDALRLTLSLGGDTDTNCAIVGSIAEALYGIKDEIKNKCDLFLPDEYKKVLSIKKNNII